MRGKRRRKTSFQAKKNSLIFTESPVSILRNVPSPVFASDHPVTADVISIDQEADFSWVSPQFRGLPSSGVRTRRGCRNPTVGVTTRSRQLSGRQNVSNCTQRRHLPKGFVPLAMLGDKSRRRDSSEHEDISFHDDPSPEKTVDVGVNAVRNMDGSHLQSRDQTLDAIPNFDVSTPQNTLYDNSRHPQSCNVNTHGSERQGITTAEENNLRTPLDNLQSPPKENEPVENEVTTTVMSNISNFDSSSPKANHIPDKKKEVKISNGKKCTLRQRKEDNSTSPKNLNKSVQFGTQRRYTKSITLKPQKLRFGKTISDNDTHLLNCAETECVTSENQRLFDTPPRSSGTANSDVLAQDTPEAEYGLSFRKRQLKYFLRKRHSKVKT